MWLIATTVMFVTFSVAWYKLQTEIAKCEAAKFGARAKAFEAACKLLKTAKDAERLMGTLGLIVEASKGE
jgi:hypothetical protein